ncbi:MAG: histidinol-phosphatase HisJ family protein [Acutalibacteraceae bacterium]|nr:histidinol-phosphatase HisJ family protein [Acutalibacteraceae bacterium]
MQHKQNLHIHTTYADGKDGPEEIVIEAVKRGFDSIGFSEHSYMSFSSYPYQMKIEDMPKYQAEIRRLKDKYKNVIDIFCGMELEMYSSVPTDNFDYLIGSVHYLDFGDNILGFDRSLEETIAYINTNFGGKGIEFAKKYYKTVANLSENRKIDIIGHFDLVTKNNEKGKFIDTSSKEYLDFGFEAIHALKGKIPFFEVNTGAISRGYRTSPYPQIEFLKEFNRCGFGVVITSDCHDKNFIDCYYEEAKELIAEAGFKSKWVLKSSGFEEVSL